MGFFNNLVKSFNPLNPGRAIKNASTFGLDPAGSLVRGGKSPTGDMTPHNIKGVYDPGGLIGGQPQAAPNSYAPQPAMHLSAGAQAMYDDMKARMAARQSGVAYSPTPTTPAAAALPHRTPLGQQAPQTQTPYDPGMGPQQLADGGMVDGEREYDGDYFESKAFERKPNGKPY